MKKKHRRIRIGSPEMHERDEPGDYMAYRRWRKTQPWSDQVDHINKEIFKERER